LFGVQEGDLGHAFPAAGCMYWVFGNGPFYLLLLHLWQGHGLNLPSVPFISTTPSRPV